MKLNMFQFVNITCWFMNKKLSCNSLSQFVQFVQEQDMSQISHEMTSQFVESNSDSNH